MRAKDQTGFSMVGFAFTLVAVLLTMIVFMIIFRPLLVMRQTTATPSGLHLVSTYARACILNSQAWAATVSDPDNKSMECLRKNTECNLAAITPPASYIKLKASPGAGDFCFQNYNTMPGINTDGFTAEGVACKGFSDAGNDQCPFRYNVYWAAECPGGAKSCRNPVVRVNGDMVTGSKDQRNGNATELKRYSLRTVRGRAEQTKYFFLAEVAPSGQAAPGTPCKLEGSVRAFNVAYDPGGYVELKKDGTMILAPGAYSCHVSVPGYRVGNFKAALMDVTAAPFKPRLIGTSEYSPVFNNYAQTRSEIAGAFSLQAKTSLAVLQFCSSSASQPSEKLRSMGVPVASRVPWPETYSYMQCWVL